ncbi:MAG: DUF4416 family protein [Deltaproteobacteria bacterium]|nr:DUF4416 family protein [Deltaproteobacteria bacterium]
MSRPDEPNPVKLIVGLLAPTAELAQWAVSHLEWVLGPVDLISEAVPFDWTDYYRPELGPGLTRRWISFLELVNPGRLAEFKLVAVDLEQKLARPDGRRRVNLDPGLLSLEGLVLASTKKAGHRIYLGQGVWAELTLIFEEGRFKAFKWTYPDYAAGLFMDFAQALRKRYKMQLKEGQWSEA